MTILDPFVGDELLKGRGAAALIRRRPGRAPHPGSIFSMSGYAMPAKPAMNASLPSFAQAGFGLTSSSRGSPSAAQRKSKRP